MAKIQWLVYIDRGGLLGEIEAERSTEAMAAAERCWPEHAGCLQVASKPAMERQQRKLERQAERELPRRAYHEAGHVVFAHNLGPGVQRVSLRVQVCSAGGRFDPYADSTGITEFKRWPRNVVLSSHNFRDQAEAKILTAMAGPMAEARFRGCRMVWQRFSGSDAQVVNTLAPHHSGGFSPACTAAYIAYLRARATEELEVCWHLVEALAAALIERRELSKQEIRDCLDQADVMEG
jgi:hypothetical protein